MPWKPDYVAATDVAAYLRVDDTVDNAEFGILATAASRAVDKKCNRQFGVLASAAPRTYYRNPYFDPSTGMWLLEIDDVQDTTGLLVGGIAYASSSTVLFPPNAAADGLPWTHLAFLNPPTPSSPGVPVPIVVTAKWGWTAVPSQVITACKLQCARWNARRDSPFGVAGSPENGSEMRLLAKLDPDVATVLVGLIRPRRVA